MVVEGYMGDNTAKNGQIEFFREDDDDVLRRSREIAAPQILATRCGVHF